MDNSMLKEKVTDHKQYYASYPINQTWSKEVSEILLGIYLKLFRLKIGWQLAGLFRRQVTLKVGCCLIWLDSINTISFMLPIMFT